MRKNKELEEEIIFLEGFLKSFDDLKHGRYVISNQSKQN
jgi:hypothetical protein